MTPDERSAKILNETDPYLRIIWSLGYDKVIINHSYNIFFLYKGDDKVKEFPLNEIRRLHWELKTITGILPNGEHHTWLSDADGSADKFRNYINGKAA